MNDDEHYYDADVDDASWRWMRREPIEDHHRMKSPHPWSSSVIGPLLQGLPTPHWYSMNPAAEKITIN